MLTSRKSVQTADYCRVLSSVLLVIHYSQSNLKHSLTLTSILSMITVDSFLLDFWDACYTTVVVLGATWAFVWGKEQTASGMRRFNDLIYLIA